MKKIIGRRKSKPIQNFPDKVFFAVFFILLIGFGFNRDMNAQLTAKGVVRWADDKFTGEETSIMNMTMKIVRPDWERTVSFKMWVKGRDYALTLVTAPPKEAGQTFLKRENEMWNWNPRISRMIKLPPSMMSQGWMGSDYTNDDVLKEASIVKDYHHEFVGKETVNGYECHKIRLEPKEEAAVVWGRIMMWISREGYYQMKAQYYDEDNYLIRTMEGSEIEMVDDRKIPTRTVIIPADEPGNKTIVKINDASFNEPIPDGFFSQQNMKRVR